MASTSDAVSTAAPTMRPSNFVERLLSATVSSFITSMATTPLDVVKVRMQAQNHKLIEPLQRPAPIKNTSHGIYSIGRNEGVRMLYRGLVPTMAMSLPSTVIYFLGYESLRKRIGSHIGHDNLFAPLLSGSLARVSPIELLRTKMQYHGVNGSIGKVSQTLAGAIRTDGIKVLWKGLIPTLWRDVPFSGIYWVCIEQVRPVIRSAINPDESQGAGKEFATSFSSGAISGMVAAALTTPFDVAKTRRQIEIAALRASPHYSLREQLSSIWQEEGARGLTRGIVPRVCKVAPACAIMLGSYEVGKIYFSRIV